MIKRGAGILPQGGRLCITCTRGALRARKRAQADTHQISSVNTVHLATHNQGTAGSLMQASCIKTSDALVDTADTNTKASLPGAPRGFFWLEHPRGRMPGHAAP